MRFFQTIAYSLTVWLLAALINAFLIAVVFSMENAQAGRFFIFFPGIVASLFFSAPGMFCFWIVFLIAVYSNRAGQSLFRLLLATGICCSLCTGVAVGYILRGEPGMSVLKTAVIAVASAMLSLFAHRKSFIFINKPSIRLNHV
jgi:hypothetical protein